MSCAGSLTGGHPLTPVNARAASDTGLLHVTSLLADCGGDLTGRQPRINHTATTPIVAASNPADRSVESGISLTVSSARRMPPGNTAYSTPSTTNTKANAVSRSCTGAGPDYSDARSAPSPDFPAIELKYRKKSLSGDSTIVVVSLSVIAVR